MPNARRLFLQRTLWAGFGLWLGGPTLLAATGGERTYVVRKGDTLSLIARREGTTVTALRSRNRLTGDLIKVGDRLTIPAASRVVAESPSTNALIAGVAAATARIRVDPSRWAHIVMHHSAIEAGNAKAYGSAHMRRGMEHGLAYHFVIGNGQDSGDGEIEIGGRWTNQLRGGHVRSTQVNDAGIGICIVGNLENHPPTARQAASLYALIDYLRAGRVSTRHRVTVHKWVDRNHTVCPGRRFPYAELARRYGAKA